jgi:hypothetical protein
MSEAVEGKRSIIEIVESMCHEGTSAVDRGGCFASSAFWLERRNEELFPQAAALRLLSEVCLGRGVGDRLDWETTANCYSRGFSKLREEEIERRSPKKR